MIKKIQFSHRIFGASRQLWLKDGAKRDLVRRLVVEHARCGSSAARAPVKTLLMVLWVHVACLARHTVHAALIGIGQIAELDGGLGERRSPNKKMGNEFKKIFVKEFRF